MLAAAKAVATPTLGALQFAGSAVAPPFAASLSFVAPHHCLMWHKLIGGRIPLIKNSYVNLYLEAKRSEDSFVETYDIMLYHVEFSKYD